MNYTVKSYFFEQSAVREFYSGAYYDLFLVMRGSGVFRCSEVVLPAQQQNLIIFKPGQGGRLEYAGAYGPLELIRVQLSPQTLAQLSDADTNLEKSFNVVPFRQVAVRPDSQIYMLLKNLARKLLMLPQERTQFGAAVFEHGILQMFVVLALRACIHAEFHTASVSRHHLMLDEVFLFIQAHLTEELTLERLEKEFFVSREHIAREFKRQTGQTVHRYIVKARLDRCCTLIEQGLPITEVYKTSGFGGYNHFFRAFKKEYGMTPKEYFKPPGRTPGDESAKAAPSAPVKKAAREDLQILPAACLSPFFAYFQAGEAVQRHHNQHEKADDQQDTGHADEHHGQGGHPGRKMKHKGTSVKPSGKGSVRRQGRMRSARKR